MSSTSPPDTAAHDIPTYARMAQRAALAWVEDRAASMGAALSYYTLFSLAPLLLIVVSVAGAVFGVDAARDAVMDQLRTLVGREGADVASQLLQSVNRPASGFIATAVGVVLMLVGATTVFAELQATLDHIWRAPARVVSGVWGVLRSRVLSFGMILGLSFLLLVSLVISAMLAAVQAWLSPMLGFGEQVMLWLGHGLSFAVVTTTFAFIYKFMPRVRIAWADVWLGAVVTSALFAVGRLLIGLYLSHSAVASGFGAAGSVVILLVWVYFSAQIFLLGAEFTWVYSHTLGSRRGEASATAGAVDAARVPADATQPAPDDVLSAEAQDIAADLPTPPRSALLLGAVGGLSALAAWRVMRASGAPAASSSLRA